MGTKFNWKTAAYVAFTVATTTFHLIGACWMFNEVIPGYTI
jgi:hypothetical protein